MIRITSIVASLSVVVGCAGGGATSSSSGGGSNGVTASSASASASGAGGATGACTACDGVCVDTRNDPRHCGACGKACGAAKPLCDRGACAEAPCDVVGPICPLDHVCCGEACCPPWKMCCNAPGMAAPICVDLDAGACPTSCSGCQ
jgi:hypothetical protein